MKCVHCHETKAIEEFRIRSDNGRRSGWCKTCQRAASRDHRGRMRLKDPKADNAKTRAWKTGVSASRLLEILESQGGRCAICRRDLDPLDTRSCVIDHDHACCNGKVKNCGQCVRGLLCNRCNSVLGMVSDSPSLLNSMVGYLTGELVETISS